MTQSSSSSSFEGRVLRLVSPTIDIVSRPSRISSISAVFDDVVVVGGDVGGGTTNNNNRRELGIGGLASRAASRCSSVMSYGRLADILVVTIIAEVDETIRMMEKRGRGEEGGSSSSSSLSVEVEEEGVDRHHDDDDDDDDDEKGGGGGGGIERGGGDNLRALCRALCRTLCLSGDESLTERIVIAMSKKWSMTLEEESSSSGASSSSAALLLYEKFAEAAERGSIGVVCPALSLASSVLLQPPASTSSSVSSSFSTEEATTTTTAIVAMMVRLADAFTDRTFSVPGAANGVGGGGVPSPADVRMALVFLRVASNYGTFDARSSSVVSLRLRSHPERALPLVESILMSYAPSSSSRRRPGEEVVVSNDVEMNPDLIPSITRHLRSTKAQMRSVALRTLVLLARSSPPSSSCSVAVARAMCDELVGDRPSSSSSSATPEIRAGTYAVLEGIARGILSDDDDGGGGGWDGETASELVNAVLVALTGCLPRDRGGVAPAGGGGTSSAGTSSSTVTPEPTAREAGINALLCWMRLHQRLRGGAADGGAEGGSGYERALEYLAEPIAKYNAKDGEFRFRLGSLIVPPASTYLSSIAGAIDVGGGGGGGVWGGDEAFLVSVTSDLVGGRRREAAIRAGLTAIVDAAVKRHASSDVVPQIDGALAVLLMILHASDRSSSSSKYILPASASKMVIAGGTERGHETSFLYSPSFLETARTDALANYALHRIVALHCTTTSESDGGGGDAKDKPLVRILPKRLEEGSDRPYSAAARALAACIANPRRPPSSSSSRASFSSVRESIEAVVARSPPTASSADAIALALFDRVNERSLAHEGAASSPNETRSSRESFDPIDEASSRRHPPPTSVASGGTIRVRPSATVASHGYDPSSVRSVANLLLAGIVHADALGRTLVLGHAGLTTRSNRRQWLAVASGTLDRISDSVMPFVERSDHVEGTIDGLARFIAHCAASARLDCRTKKEGGDVVADGKSDAARNTDAAKEGGGLVLSSSIHDAATGLIRTLGGIAGSFDTEYDDDEDDEKKPYAFASKLCMKNLPKHLISHLTECLVAVESLTETDVALFQSPRGVLFRPPGGAVDQAGGGVKPSPGTSQSSVVEKRKGKKKGGGGFNAAEEEEWERQVRKDLEKKKNEQERVTSTTSERALSSQEKELLNNQAARREEVEEVLIGEFPRILAAIRCLCKSDIEIGNSCLPIFGQTVIASVVSTCAALSSVDQLRDDAFNTLSTLASCVYEIDEIHAPTIARALVISFQGAVNEGLSQKGTTLRISALPSPCAPAARSIFEMDEYGDCLSGNSFIFLFPIVRAALTGSRNIPGCDACLSVLQRHCSMLTSDEEDVNVKSLRRDMASTVLELLSHDRSQTFANPTPYEALVNCYLTNDKSSGLALSAPEIAPLLGERGALGSENTRVASMETLASIAQRHPKLIRSNPLIENRIWLNCFASKDRIKNAARRCWLIAHGHDHDVSVEASTLDSPSKLYAVPLLPLLSHEDNSIASAAAASLAYAMGMHPDSAEKNIVKICNTYIASFPASGEEEQPKQSASPFPVQPPSVAKNPIKKKVIDTGLPKKKTKVSNVSASMAKITGAPAPKKSAATKKLLAKSVAPKMERTLDQDELMDQFKTQVSVKKVTAEEDSDGKVAIRMGAISAISSLTDSSANVKLDLPVLKILIGFLMAFGLGDGNESVRNTARNAARDIVAHYGSSDEAISFLLPQLESVLKTGQVDIHCVDPLNPEKVPTTIAASDRRKEGVVVSLGSIALHLKDDSDESKIDDIIDMLLGALNTPSEDVQSSVAQCLSKIMKKGRTQERIEPLLNDLIMECIHGSSLASRRGAAYGISAAVKGSGIASLKKYDVVKRLEEACTSGAPSSKEGALFCIELLSSRLGILFEPYVIVLLPALLKAFSDSNDHVRVAADKTVGLIMGNLSGHGVKLVMPAVLDAFNEPEWRTKQASIHMLGSMSHLAPKQLASCLPKVVPKLTEAFSDTHPKVKSSAEQALEEICKVIKNPEISSISPTLLRALTDASGTLRALEALISTEFIHAIDAPSLSIIIPVVHRGLRDRAATTKRYAALISGNICTMVNDPRDFVPYLPILLPDLKSTLLDPIPDVRSISAKSLGSLTRGLGEATFPDLRPWLIDTLRSEGGNSVERSGAAQGLSELLVASGAQLTENVMINEILPLFSHPKAGTREGVLWVLTFLPSVLGQAYSSLIDESLPALLSGLADDSETVREVALRAGRVLVKSHGKAHKDKILPSLEEGLNNEDYRIRVASLTLLGDLLGMLGGTKVGKTNTDTQDDIRQTERAQAQIALALGDVTRARVLSSLYLARSDTAAVVRQLAVQVWKTVVSVTARTLKEILSVLVDQIVIALASGDPERTQVAGRCLGDIVEKLGDQSMDKVIPVLRDNLYRGDNYTRQGVCVGLAEVINCSSKEQITKFLEILVKVVQDALCDTDSRVRTLAASCFQNLYNAVGNRTLDEIVPALLLSMDSDDDVTKTRALNGMTGILGVRSRELLPYIIPRLLKTPLTVSHADALGSISRATGGTIHMHFSSIIPTLILELATFSEIDDEAREEAVRRCCRAVCHNVDTTGVNWLISEIVSKCTHDKYTVRKEACWAFQVVVEEREKAADFYAPLPVILRELLHRLNDDSSIVLKANQMALGALTSLVPAEELVNHLQFIRNLIASMVSDARYRKGGVGDGEFFLPGFNIPKGLEPLMPIYQRGILYGNATERETAAAGLGELITITANKYLAGPFLIKLTGPLLRIVGDRNPPAVKIAIVQTLGLILTKGGPALRAFVPQFQTTFVKALSDPSRQVRIEAIKALALLMPLSSRVDPLIKELVSTSLGKGSNVTIETAGIVTIQTATLEALAVVLKHGGGMVKVAESIPSSLDAAKELIRHEDDGIRESAAKVIGYACELLGTDEADSVLQELVLDKASTLSSCSPEIKHGIACICRRVFSRSVGQKISRSTYKSASSLIQNLMKDEKLIVKESSCAAIGAILGSSTEIKTTISLLENSIVKCMDTKEELSVQQAVANGLCIAARLQPGIFRTEEGLNLINNALKLAMSGAQRVQFSYNDFLWIALDVQKGGSGLEEYLSLAHFDSAKKMQAIYSKVLLKIKSVNDDEL